jgi:hypothetical protein
MKIIELNIGLSSKKLGTLNPNVVLNSLTGRGFECIKHRLVESVCKDGEETCLAWKGKAPADWQAQLADLSERLGQDCIAVCGFIGQSPYDTFCADLWVSPEAPEAPEAQFNGFTRQEFLGYLEFCIIPDSRLSGFDAYADDLETALHFLRRD